MSSLGFPSILNSNHLEIIQQTRPLDNRKIQRSTIVRFYHILWKTILLLKIAVAGLSKKTKSVQTCWRKIATLRIPPLCTMSFKVNIVLQLDFLQKSLCIFFARKSTTCSFGEFIALTKISLMVARKDKELFLRALWRKNALCPDNSRWQSAKKWLKQNWLIIQESSFLLARTQLLAKLQL